MGTHAGECLKLFFTLSGSGDQGAELRLSEGRVLRRLPLPMLLLGVPRRNACVPVCCELSNRALSPP
jgi:hypothetical protein